MNWRALTDLIVCAIFGHSDVMSMANGRVFLRCTSCDRRTPGWTTRRTA